MSAVVSFRVLRARQWTALAVSDVPICYSENKENKMSSSCKILYVRVPSIGMSKKCINQKLCLPIGVQVAQKQ
jgi:hypothetical protein